MCALHKSRRIGEVVETSTVQFAVECDELDVVPELGSFVRVGGTGVDAIYGIVAYAETTAVDPGRRVVRRGSAQLQDRALYEANPELRFVLRSLFLAVAMAYEHSRNLMFLVPPFPPPLHYSVELVPEGDVGRLTDACAYFALLFDFTGPVPAEQLLAAHLYYVYRKRGQDWDWLERAAKEIARLSKRDYECSLRVLGTLEVVLQRELHR